MSKEEKSFLTRSISRRSFLKGSLAAAAAMSASSAMAFAEEQAAEATAAAAQEQVFCGSCRGNCGGQCFLNLHVRDGKLVRTSARDLPDPAYNRICIKGLTQPYRIYGKDRLKYPLRRVGERGAGEDGGGEAAEKRACEEVGFYSEVYEMPADTKQQELNALVDKLNADEKKAAENPEAAVKGSLK